MTGSFLVGVTPLCRRLLPTEERLLGFETTERVFSNGELSVSDVSDSSNTARLRLLPVGELRWGILGVEVAFLPLEVGPSLVLLSL